MPRPSRPWFRFYVEALWDRKLRRESPACRWLWISLLGMARSSPKAGYLLVGEGQPAVEADIVDAAALRPIEVRAGMVALERAGMIVLDDEVWMIPKWWDRQFESDDVTERTAQHRRKNVATNGHKSAEGTSPETETEAETETETPPPSVGPPRRRGTRIPDEWDVTAEHVEWVGKECPSVDWRFETAAWVDHWKSSSRSNAVKLDWLRAWRNWMREAQRRAGGRRR